MGLFAEVFVNNTRELVRKIQLGFVRFQNYVKIKPLKGNPFAKGSSLGIAIACIAVFVVIVIGIIVLRKRTQRVPVSHGFVEVRVQ